MGLAAVLHLLLTVQQGHAGQFGCRVCSVREDCAGRGSFPLVFRDISPWTSISAVFLKHRSKDGKQSVLHQAIPEIQQLQSTSLSPLQSSGPVLVQVPSALSLAGFILSPGESLSPLCQNMPLEMSAASTGIAERAAGQE